MSHLNNKKSYKNDKYKQSDTRLKKSVRLSSVDFPALKQAFQKRGIHDIRIVQDWHKIVGDRLASKTVVDKIVYDRNKKYSVLHINTLGAFATELSYQSDYIIQKINMYLGFSGIGALKIHHTLPMDYVYRGHTDDDIHQNHPKPKTDIAVIEEITDENIKNSLRRIAGFVYNDDNSQ